MAPLAYEGLSRSDPLELVRALAREVAELRAENALLRRELEEGTGCGRKRSRKNSGKRPGRKPGQGAFTNRKPPENPSGSEGGLGLPDLSPAPRARSGETSKDTGFAQSTRSS